MSLSTNPSLTELGLERVLSVQCRFYSIGSHSELWTFPASKMLAVKNPPASAGDVKNADSIPGSGRSPGGGHGNPLQYSRLDNPMDRGAWQATVHRVTQSQTRPK